MFRYAKNVRVAYLPLVAVCDPIFSDCRISADSNWLSQAFAATLLLTLALSGALLLSNFAFTDRLSGTCSALSARYRHADTLCSGLLSRVANDLTRVQ